MKKIRLAINSDLIKASRFKLYLSYVIFDFLILTCSFILAIIIFGDFSLLYSPYSWVLIVVSVFSALSVLYITRFYNIIVRYISARAALPVTLAIIVSSSVAFIGKIYLASAITFPVIILYSLLGLINILGFRYIYRDIIIGRSGKRNIRVIIYGAGQAGRQFLNSLNTSDEYSPIAFIDDNPKLKGRFIGGLEVFERDDLKWLVDNLKIDVLAFVIPSISSAKRREILNSLEDLGIQIRVVPGLVDLMSKSVRTIDVKPLSIRDVLGRIPVPPVKKLITTPVKDRVIMVTGAGGSIGSEICRQAILNKPITLVLLDLSEYALYKIDQELNLICQEKDINVRIIPILGSVQDEQRIRSILKKFKVQTIYHAAAFKHVPLVEQNIVEGIKNNVFGTKTLIKAAVEAEVDIFTLISSDKAVRPTNIMGASKRMAEFVCSSFAGAPKTRISMVRFGNVIGSSGSVVPLFEEQIHRGGPVTVTDPSITRFFMTITEAAQLVIQASSMAKGGEVYLLDMGKPVKILDLAIRMIKIFGKAPIIVKDLKNFPLAGHIPIIFTGLRPGEKIYEELLVNSRSQKTDHPLIMSAVETGPESHEVAQCLELLEQACKNENIEDISSILVDIGTGLNHSKNFVDHSLREND